MFWIAQKGAGPGSKLPFPSLSSLHLGFGNKHDATVDIPLETMNVSGSILQIIGVNSLVS